MAFILHPPSLRPGGVQRGLRRISSAPLSRPRLDRFRKDRSVRPRSAILAKASLPWQTAFDAAVLNRPATQQQQTAGISQSPAAPQDTRGLTAARIRHLFSTTWRLAAPFWRADRTAGWHGAACAILHVLDTTMGALFTELSGNLFTALNERQVSAFARGNLMAFGLCMLAVPISALKEFVRGTLVLRWQQFLTKRGLDLYFERGNYYRLANLKSAGQNHANATAVELDNPDEVLHRQFASFADNLVDIAMSNLRTVLEVVLYSVMLLRIFPPLYVVIVCIVGAGMLLINLLGKRLVDLEALFLRRTADFRFALARIRIHAESIAFYNGARFEKTGAEGKLDSQAETILQLEKVRFPVDMFINSFYYLPTVIPLLVLGPLYFAKRLQLGQMTKSITAFNVLFANLSIFVGGYDRYASLGASIERLSKFVSSLEGRRDMAGREFKLPPAYVEGNNPAEQSVRKVPQRQSQITVEEERGSAGLKLSSLCVDTPMGSRRVLADVSLTLRPRERMLVVGQSGRGKTSLLRAIAGLWTDGSGTITRPPRSQMFFMPQRPYCVQGTLREQLLYPNRVVRSDDDLEEVLRLVELPGLCARAGGLSAVEDWAEYLSVGENQRLAFARLLIAKPALVLIDEGTSAVDLQTEDMLMQLVRGLGCTVVSVGHRPSLVKFHDQVLHLGQEDGNGVGYATVPADEFVYPGVA